MTEVDVVGKVLEHPLFALSQEVTSAIDLAKRMDVTMLDVSQLANVVTVIEAQYRELFAALVGQVIGMEMAYTEALQEMLKRIKEIEG